MPKRLHSLARVLRTVAAGSLFAALPLLSACGQKGPLTLAAPPAPAASAPSSAQ